MKTSAILENDIWQFITDIESRKITLNALEDPQDIYAGNVTYHASNGWKIVVFNDANEWDYIDSIIDLNGNKVDHYAIDRLPKISSYEPKPEVAWKMYGIPGHMRFRCKCCEKAFKRYKYLTEHKSNCPRVLEK